jgi:hypothetical protein
LDFHDAAVRAVETAFAEISQTPSPLAARTLAWLGKRCDLLNPAAYFTQTQSLPLLAFPWWLEESIHAPVEVEFQLDLMYSMVNLYYFTRMLDDVMDGHEIEPALLPALHPFHVRFMSRYHRHFGPESPFWREFDRLLAITVETTATEATLSEFTAGDFLNSTALKATAAAIPIAAVCVRFDRLDLLRPWESMFSLFAKWHLMRDDLLDWGADAKAGNPTWLLSEAQRRRSDGESLAEWMGREGFAWVKAIQKTWLDETIAAAAVLNSPGLLNYLQERERLFSLEIDSMIAMAEACQALRKVDALLGRGLSSNAPARGVT